MEMKLSIDQDDIEQAIRDYVATKGITTPVRAIHFTVSRKGGFALAADVQVSEVPATPVAETPEPVAEEAPEAAAPKPRAKPKAVAKAEPVAQESEPVTEEDNSVPFDTDAKNDATAEEVATPVSASKSLFG